MVCTQGRVGSGGGYSQEIAAHQLQSNCDRGGGGVKHGFATSNSCKLNLFGAYSTGLSFTARLTIYVVTPTMVAELH